jgi:hypothetical protein
VDGGPGEESLSRVIDHRHRFAGLSLAGSRLLRAARKYGDRSKIEVGFSGFPAHGKLIVCATGNVGDGKLPQDIIPGTAPVPYRTGTAGHGGRDS